ncbi:MAG: glycosyltransferase [Opitutales bacterium]
MRTLFIDQADWQVSGVTTYGRWLHRTFPTVEILQLGGAALPLDTRCRRLPEGQAHQPEKIVEAIENWVNEAPDTPALILPNAGQTAHEAARLWLLAHPDHPSVRFLGFAHNDDPNTGLILKHYEALFAGIIAVSEHLTERLSQKFSAEARRRLHTLPYPQPESAHSSAAGLDSTQPLRLVYVGRLEETQKRVSRLVEVAHRLKAMDVPFTLQVVGAGPEEHRLPQAFVTAGLLESGHVRFIGRVPPEAVAEHLARADVCLLTSAYEGNPLALAEAMAARVCPVVMKIDSGVDEVVIEDETGCLVPQGDTTAMAEVLADLHRNRPRLERLKTAARARILSQRGEAAHREAFQRIASACFAQPLPKAFQIPELSPQEAAVETLLQRVLTVSPETPTFIYGAGNFGRSLADRCASGGLSIDGFVDADPLQQGRAYSGLYIHEPSALPNSLRPESILLGSREFGAQMRARLASIYRSARCPMPTVIGLDQD